MTKSPKPIDLGRTDSPGEARDKFYNQVMKLKAADVIDVDEKISSDEMFKLLKEQLESDIRNEKIGGRKFLFFGPRKEEWAVYLQYAWEDVAYFKIDDIHEYWEFLGSFYQFTSDADKALFNKYLQEELSTTMTKEQINKLYESVVMEAKTKKEHKDDRDFYRRQESILNKGNNQFERALIAQADLLTESMETLALDFQDTNMKLFLQLYKDSTGKLNKLTDKLLTTPVTSADRSELYKIKSEIFVTICEVKYFIDKFKVPGHLFKRGWVDFDRNFQTILEWMWFDKWWGFLWMGKNVWKNKRIKETIKYIEAIDLIAMPWTTWRKYEKAMKRIEKYEETYPDFVYTWVLPDASGARTSARKTASRSGWWTWRKKWRGRVKSSVATRTTTAYTGAPSSGIDPTAGASLSSYSSKDDLGSLSWKRVDVVKTKWIEIRMGTDWIPYVKIDRTQVTPEVLIEWYMREREKADGESRRSKNWLWNYSFAIMDEIFEHPENKDFLLRWLGWTDWLAWWKNELQIIMKSIFMGTDYQLKLKNMFRDLKNDMDDNHLPPEFGMYEPDTVAEYEDALWEIAFYRTIPDQFKMYSHYFERFTKGDHVKDMPQHAKVQEFMNWMWVSNIAWFVKESFEWSRIDISKPPTVWEATVESWISQAWGTIDRMKYNSIDWIENSWMVPESMQGVAKGATKWLAKASEWFVKWTPFVMLWIAWWNWVKTIWNTVWAMFSSPGKDQSWLWNVVGTFRDGLFGKKKDWAWNPLSRNHFGWVFAPAMAWLWISAADKKPGTEWVFDRVAWAVDDDAKARNDARKQINAVEYDRETLSPDIWIKSLLWWLTMQEIFDRWLVDANDSTGKNQVNLEAFSEEELALYLPAFNFRGDSGKMKALWWAMWEILRSWYHLWWKLMEDLVYEYPNTPLNDLLSRFDKHKVSPSFGVNDILPDSIYNDDEFNRMNYLPDDAFEKKAEEISFIGQQWNKLNETSLIDDFVMWPVDIPRGKDASWFLGTIKWSMDKDWVTFDVWSQNLFRELATLAPWSTSDALLKKYYRGLCSAIWNTALLVSVAPAAGGPAVNESVWYWWSRYGEWFEAYFQDPTIGNWWVKKYFPNPTLWMPLDYPNVHTATKNSDARAWWSSPKDRDSV